ncbi:MAG: HAD hydrolase family protein [Akkermansiaceae bacterium]|nr:HAD hydrolase family protein [Akkermansiaceae bacterium]MCF7732170.1 HAD hydrolase family protein [Akkermansiaceae bacterium]
MKPLAPLPLVTTVLSFDFDGTLHVPDETPPVPREFFELIRRLRGEHAISWGINTGRSLPLAVEGFQEGGFPFAPDWVVAREREIYYPKAVGGWAPHHEWNHACEKQLHALFKEARPLLDAVRRMIEEYTGAQWIAMDGEPAGAISRTEDEMDWIVHKMGPLVADEPRLGWQRNSIYLRFGHRNFHKGSCLSEVARHYDLGAPRCFAIGDSHNDLEMLDPAHARMLACPGNAVDEVKQQVAHRGGYVAEAQHGAGVIEALGHYFRFAKTPG